MLDRLPWSHSYEGSGARDVAVDARGSTVQFANGFLYLNAAAEPAQSLIGYDEPPQFEADAAAIARKLEAIAKGYRCVHLAGSVNAAIDAASAIVGDDATVADALAGEPETVGLVLIAIENASLAREGAWFASRSWRRKPDAIVIGEAVAAGAAFGAVLVRAKVHKDEAVQLSVDPALDRTSLRRVAGVIQVVEARGLLTQTRRMAAYLMERLRSVKATSEGEIAALSRLSFGASIAFRTHSAAQMKRKLCERGVLAGVAGGRLIVAPPLVIRPAEIDVISGALRGALNDTPTWRPSACCAACEDLVASG